jgi:predicted  nucleic acid-binding Zn-ribbon protein
MGNEIGGVTLFSKLTQSRGLLFGLLLLSIFTMLSTSAWAQRGPDSPESDFQQGLPKADIVFVMDESGSFFNDALAVDANINVIARVLETSLDYNIGIVGFGAFDGHGGTSYEGQPYVSLPLTSDMNQFSDALKRLVTVGKYEYGFNALQLAASSEMEFRPNSQACIIMITDEDADIDGEHPAIAADAIAAIQARNAYFLGVVDFDHGTTVEDYGPGPNSVSTAADGSVFDIYSFRENPAPVLREILSACIKRVQDENGMGDGNGETTPPPDTSGDLRLIVTRLVEQQNDFIARLSAILVRLDLLESRDPSGVPADLEDRLDEYDRNFARINIFLQNLEENFALFSRRLDANDEALTSMRVSIAALQDSDAAILARLSELEARIAGFANNEDLNALLAWRTEASEQLASLLALFGQVDSLRADLDALIASEELQEGKLDELSARVETLAANLTQMAADLGGRVTSLEGRLDAFDAAFGALQSKLGDLDAFNAQFQDLSSRLAALQGTVDDHDKEIERLKELAGSWDQEIAALTSKVSDLASQVADLSGLSDRVSDLETALANLDARLADTEDALTGRIDTNEADIGNLQRDLEDAQRQIEDLLRQLEDNAFALQSDLDSLASSLGSRIQSLLRRIQSLEGGVGADAETMRQLENLANLISQLQVRMAELSSQQNAQYEELTGKIERNEEWIMMIEAYLGLGDDKEGTSIDERMNAIEARLSELAANQRESQRSIGDLQNALDALRNQMAELEGRTGGESAAIDPARLRAAQRLAELAFLTAVAAIGLSLLFFLSKS